MDVPGSVAMLGGCVIGVLGKLGDYMGIELYECRRVCRSAPSGTHLKNARCTAAPGSEGACELRLGRRGSERRGEG